jgi:hypothetical protein
MSDRDRRRDWRLEELEGITQELAEYREALPIVTQDLLEAIQTNASDEKLSYLCREFADIKETISMFEDRLSYIKDELEEGVSN